MYRIVIIAGLAFACPVTQAGPYVGIGWQAGASKVEQRALRAPSIGTRTLDLSGSDGRDSLTALAGHRFSETLALELGWRRVGVEDGFELRQATQDEEWDASVAGHHFTLAPVYRLPVAERLAVRTTAGLLYGDYRITQSHTLDLEGGPDQTLGRATRGRSTFGGTIGLGVEYATPWKVDLVAEVSHQRTRVISHTGASLLAVYRF